MTPTGNLSFIQVGEDPKRWMQNDNKNKNTKMNTAEKEDATDSTATMTTAIFAPTTITTEKEDNTESTTTVTTATATSVCASEWDADITEVLEESTALQDQIYAFGKRRWLKPNRKWRTPISRVCNGEKNNPSPRQQVTDKHEQ